MVERVARLMCRRDAIRNNSRLSTRELLDQYIDALWPAFTDDARAVIAAAREPTTEMIQAGCDALKGVSPEAFMAAELSSDRQALAKLKQPIRWRAMVDKALGSGAPDKPAKALL